MNIWLTNHPTVGLIGPKAIAKDLEKGQGLRGGRDVWWGGVINKGGAHGYLEQGLYPHLVQEKNKKGANPHRKGLHNDPESCLEFSVPVVITFQPSSVPRPHVCMCDPLYIFI